MSEKTAAAIKVPTGTANQQPEVVEQMECLAKNLEAIGEKITALYDRLENVLQIPSPEVAKEEKDGESFVPLASELRQMVIKTAYFNERLNRLYHLLEN